MPSEQFDALVQELEIFAQNHADKYKWRVGLLAALGYAYFVLIFLVLIFVIVALQVAGNRYTAISEGNLNLITAIFCLFAIPILGINFSNPKGNFLSRAQAPKLFKLIDELTEKLNTVKFHHVILDGRVNAGVLQFQRIIFWETNYLYIGLPLMRALSPDQFYAVLIHEFAHLSNHDSRFSNWIYRLRYRWQDLNDNLFLYPLKKWYVPFFNAYSFVLARSHEYRADRCAAEIVGAETEAHSQIWLYLTNNLLEKYFWRNLFRQAQFQPKPPANIISQQLQIIQTGTNSLESEAWLEVALSENTSNQDTHPCLRERLAAIGCATPVLPPISEISAAEYFLESELSTITSQLDTQWQKDNAEWWLNLHLQSHRHQIRLNALTQKAQLQSLSLNEQLHLAGLISYFDDNLENKNAAISLLKAVLDREPVNISANYMLGKVLMELKDANGINNLEVVMQRQPIYAASCSELIYKFLIEAGEKIKAQPYLELLRKNISKCQKAGQERREIDENNLFWAHEFSASEIGELSLQLANYPEIHAAYVVRPEITLFPELPLYVLAIKRQLSYSHDGSFYQYSHLSQILKEEVFFPQEGEWIVKIFDHEYGKLEQIIRKISSGAIYKYQP